MNKRNVQLVLLGLGAAVGLYFIFKKQAEAAVTAVKNVNVGTPYQGAGIIGTAGNITNQASGGTLAEFGNWLGGKVYDLTHSGG